jgi:hypothetical protein
MCGRKERRMGPLKRVEVIGGVRYDTSRAVVIAHDAYWDGHNWDRGGTNTILFKTASGRYFTQTRSRWQGADDGALCPMFREEAALCYEALREKVVAWEEAFPGVAIVDA